MRSLAFASALVAIGMSSMLRAEPAKDKDRKPSEPERKKLTEVCTVSRLVTARHLRGTPVYNKQFVELGTVRDTVVDLQEAEVRYLAVSAPEKPPLDPRLHAVPWGAFQTQAEKNPCHLMVDISQDSFRRSPGFKPAKWPNFGNRKWAEMVDVYFGLIIKKGDIETGFGAEKRPMSNVWHLVRAQDLEGMSIQDKAGKPIGQVKNVVIDLWNGHVRYVSASFKDVDKPRFVPMQQLQPARIESQQEKRVVLELQVDAAQVLEAPVVSMRQLERMAKKIDQHYGIKEAPENKKGSNNDGRN